MANENILDIREDVSSTFFPKMGKESDDRPNILFIMTDQHRFDFLSCMGSTDVKTPNIDRIAERGMKFNYAFTNAPVCTPARISLATGLHPSRLGVADNASYLPLTTETYYQRLRNSGYQVGVVGKLDFCKPSRYNGVNGNRPVLYSYGFTKPVECEGKVHAHSGISSVDQPIGPYTNYLHEKGLLETFVESKKNHKVLKDRSGFHAATDDFAMEALDTEDGYIMQESIKWIDEITDEYPWHLFVSIVGPHYPYDPPTAYADRFRNRQMSEPIKSDLSGKPDWVKKKHVGLKEEEIQVARRQYAASIEMIDDQIGEIIKALEEKGQYDNTYIIFSTDHGDMMGDHGLFLKRFAYEGAMRIPLLICGPDIGPGQETDTLVELMDVNETICELAGLPNGNNDSKSLCDVLFGKSEIHRDNVVSEITQFRAIRTHDYKLIDNYNAETELYDVKNDPQEINNIADENPLLVKELKQELKGRYIEGKWHY